MPARGPSPLPAPQRGEGANTGTLFRIRLFLPEVHGARLDPEAPRKARIGYAGTRKRILVVDNEEVDRELLASVLEPLGFELHRAASGHECLEVIEGIAPDAVLMDLAMPGIDGWATVRAIRAAGLSSAPIAIVSGNAFDKDLENDAGISTDDFILKPVRVNELLDWLGARLQLEWVEAEPLVPESAPTPPGAVAAVPEAAQLRSLDELVNLGYYRGIVRKLDEIERLDANHAPCVTQLRGLARQFQLDAMTRLIRQALADEAASSS